MQPLSTNKDVLEMLEPFSNLFLPDLDSKGSDQLESQVVFNKSLTWLF